MNNTAKIIFSFVAGAAIGAVVTWKIAQAEYEKIIKEDVESIKEELSKRTPYGGLESEVDSTVDEEAVAEMKTIANRYDTHSDKKEEKGGSEPMQNEGIYIISPDEFGEKEDYDITTFYYYTDGILTNEQDKIVDDVEELVGDFASHFGEYEDDSVFIRNDNTESYYEIIMDNRSYAYVMSTDPNYVD